MDIVLSITKASIVNKMQSCECTMFVKNEELTVKVGLVTYKLSECFLLPRRNIETTPQPSSSFKVLSHDLFSLFSF